MNLRQHSIDLLPEEIYAQSQAGLRMGRLGAASAVVIIMLVIAATHSRWELRRAQIDYYNTSTQASQVWETEAQSLKFKKNLADMCAFVSMYEKVAFPLDMSAVLATVVRTLPDSVTLDQIDLSAGTKQAARTTRSKGGEAAKDQAAAPRILNGEISGFAISDQHVAELVSRLASTPPFKDVSLDFSRTRDVRGQSAREFRLSFKIDLDAAYRGNGAVDSILQAIASESKGDESHVR